MAKLKRSPYWSQTTKIVVTVSILILISIGIYRFRWLVLPLMISMIVAYVLDPVVHFIQQRTRIHRTVALAIVYLLIIAALIAIPASTIPQLVEQVNIFFDKLPGIIATLGEIIEDPPTILGFSIPGGQLPIDQIIDSSLSIVQTAGTQTISLLSAVTTATIQTITWVTFVLFVSFYLIKDESHLYDAMLALVPDDFKEDAELLWGEIRIVWNSFLRGQVILSLTIFVVVTIVALILGLPSPLVLGLIAGMLEVVPYLGPILSAIPALLLAYFSNDASWLGQGMTPWVFTSIVLFAYWLVQQAENYILVPRIMGKQLKMHPLIVFIAALAGAGAAGILGVFLASPLVATVRTISRYIYNKLADQPPFSEPPPILSVPDASKASPTRKKKQIKRRFIK